MEMRIITLNCWGFPIISADRVARIQAIAQALVSMKADLVALQEIGVQEDREQLLSIVSSMGLVHSHYFKSGFLGSGLLILSRFPIVQTNFWPFSLNGRPQDLIRPDFYAEKGLAFARLESPDGNLDFYTTHFIAPYLEIGEDFYAHHRIAQAIETSRIINDNSKVDPAILAGDLNATPLSMSYLLLKQFAKLRDSYSEANPGDSGNTVTEEIPYVPIHVPERIDYILLRDGKSLRWEIASSKVVFNNVLPDFEGKILAYSDHYGVLTTAKTTFGSASFRVMTIKTQHIREALDSAQKTLLEKSVQKTWWAGLTGFLGVLFYNVNKRMPLDRRQFLKVSLLSLRIFLTLLFGYNILTYFQSADESDRLKKIVGILNELEKDINAGDGEIKTENLEPDNNTDVVIR
jgi:endonuclease/exonuclease/phosphatase family metal-dependent hydrolase